MPATEEWVCGPGDVDKEIRLLVERKLLDHFPQGWDNCLRLLRTCKEKNKSFKIKAVKTAPWTWYYYAL